MKKIIAILLAAMMVIGLAACGEKQDAGAAGQAQQQAQSGGNNAAVENTNPADAIPDAMTSEDGKYQVAFVTDVGQLKDQSFNQGTYDGVKLYAKANNKSYKYYQPANGDAATDDDRIAAMRLACDNGAEIVVAAGFMQATALGTVAAEYPDVHFVFIDGWDMEMDNVAGIVFQEEQAGYLAGYAAVMAGYTKLGFTGGGGGTNPACQRYGYGFVQGVEAAAAKKGVKAEVKYSWLHGASFSASPELQTMAKGWYQTGTEIIFACGGSMFTSVAAAAAEEECKVVGVDVDQSFQSPTVVTSAMKGLAEATSWAIAKHYDGTWSEIGNAATTLGAADKAVGLPTATWSIEGWTVADYEALFADIVAGKVAISAELVEFPANTDNVTVVPVQ